MKNQVFKIGFYAIIVASIISGSCTQKTVGNKAVVLEDSLYLKNVPPQPCADTWKFIEDLKSPMWTKHAWKTTSPGTQYVDLSGGVQMKVGFSDPGGRLQTAYEDLNSFFSAGSISVGKGVYVIETAASSNLDGESFRLEIGPKVCRILAGDVEENYLKYPEV